MEELNTLSKEQLRLARNEVFAKKGRKFEAEDLQSYFSAKSWYAPYQEPEEFDALGDWHLNPYELANIKLIMEVESQ